MRFAVLLILVASLCVGVVAAGGGCLGSDQYKCSTNVDCTRASSQGRCEAVGFCSFDDASCGGGRRFGDLSGPFANQCVPPPDAAPPDAPIDAAIDAFVPDARECFGSGAYMMCFAGMPPMGTVTLVGALDTSTDARCAAMMPQSWIDAGQPDACLIMGKAINVTGALAVTGARPLVLLGDVVTISGVIDVASHRGAATLTPGAPATQCAVFVSVPGSDPSGSGGGAGGSFMRRGGNGGRGSSAASLGGTAAAADTVAPTVLRGGCPGQPGALGGTGSTVGAAGQGGGAIFITASNLTITSAGGINVSGAGAIGGTVNAGGSGGGAGGMIVLHVVENLTTTGARLLANGGGGSAGADMGVGTPGSDPVATMPTTPAPGGNGPGAAGGDGFAGSTQAQPGNNAGGSRDTGGGGGGGGGYIQSNQALTGATVSPAATIVP